MLRAGGCWGTGEDGAEREICGPGSDGLGPEARDLGVHWRGRHIDHPPVLETCCPCSVCVCIWAPRCSVEFQATWLIQFTSNSWFQTSGEFSSLPPQTCFFPLGYLLAILWDNYFMPQFFSLNLQAPLPSHPFHDQLISEVSAGCENRRNEMGAFNLTPSHLETCKPWKYFFLCPQASVVWRPPFLQFCQGFNSCVFLSLLTMSSVSLCWIIFSSIQMGRGFCDPLKSSLTLSCCS